MSMDAKPITGAELKTRLGGLGLPPTFLATRMGVTMRTVVRWFDGDGVSQEVADELQRLEAKTLEEMTRMLEEIDDTVVDATLRTYRTDEEFSNRYGWPASWHRALTFRVLEHLEAQEHTVSVEYR